MKALAVITANMTIYTPLLMIMQVLSSRNLNFAQCLYYPFSPVTVMPVLLLVSIPVLPSPNFHKLRMNEQGP